MSLGLIGHPAAASYSVDSESLPSGRVSPTLMVISVSAVSSFRRRLASRSCAAKSKCLPVPRGLAIFPAMQIAAEAIQDHRLTISEVLQALVAEGLVPKADADKLIADRRLHRGDHHPLVVIADQKWRSLKPPQKILFLEWLTEWLARQTGMDYFHIDPLKINFSAVTDVMSSHYAARFKILPVEVSTREVVIATCEPYVKDWEKELKQILRLEIRRVIANPLDISRYQVEFYNLAHQDPRAHGRGGEAPPAGRPHQDAHRRRPGRGAAPFHAADRVRRKARDARLRPGGDRQGFRRARFFGRRQDSLEADDRPAERHHPRDGADRLGQDHHALFDPEDARHARGERLHDRGPDRDDRARLQPDAGAAVDRARLRRGRARAHAPRPGYHHGG